MNIKLLKKRKKCTLQDISTVMKPYTSATTYFFPTRFFISFIELIPFIYGLYSIILLLLFYSSYKCWSFRTTTKVTDKKIYRDVYYG